ncbi:MAG TPA: DUF4266 domain-containing protein [Polyangia bacterium]|jgi:hypothetical protein|nr:DUF4266 domain-containing protein [Polyangia bacterium]
MAIGRRSTLTTRWLPRAGLALLAWVAVAAAGCAHPPVKPWQRAYLTKRAMRFDADRLEQRFRQHLYGSREGSDLGYGQPGGGCGCN